jgi:hypothetical protein
MAKAQAHFRLEPGLLEAIKVRAEAENITITDLVTRFLKQGLGIETSAEIQTLSQQEIEDNVYQRISISVSEEFATFQSRISERISAEVNKLEERVINSISHRISLNIGDLENRVFESVSSRISSLMDETEKRISNRVSISEKEVRKTFLDLEERVSDDIEFKLPKAMRQSIQQEAKEPIILSLFETDLEDGQIMKPTEVVKLLNKQTQSNNWDITKLRNVRAKYLTWSKNRKNPDKKIVKEPPLPMVVGEYLVDWIFSEDESPTSVGKEWWIQKLPEDKNKKEELIIARRNYWINKA